MSEKEREAWDKRDAGDFLRFMGVPFSNLQCPSEFRSDCDDTHIAGPDVKVTISADLGPRRIGLELTRYSSDADKKGSVALRRKSVRGRLRKELECFLPRFPELDQFQIRVRFRRGEEELRAEDCRRIAHEVAELLGPELAYTPAHRCFDAIFRPGVFDGYPHLREHIRCIDINRNTGNHRGSSGWFDGCGWEWPGIRAEQVCRLINQHDPSRYDLADVDECWLVIYSTGHGGSAARAWEMEQRSISSLHIAEAMVRSGFDRVYFWCREFKWAALLGTVDNHRVGALPNVV